MGGMRAIEDASVLQVAKNIGRRRRELGVTQAQLAERLGVETETLSRFERGKHAPTLRNLIRLAELLQTTVTDLLAEHKRAPCDDVLVISAWLQPLSSEDRLFALGVLKQCCDYLGTSRS